MMMAFSKESQTAAAMLLVVVLLLAAEAAAADEKACMSSIVSLMPCLPYTENKAPEPSAPCCRNLAQVVQSQPICLCAVLDGEASQWMGIPVNVSRALALPPACSVQTPPTSECNCT
ncbi:hypothetical protein Taro_047494 [Colocasia esculenta]|uniref:Bifunctional inhibitor/plant lipid transfer protein/seed storage helical domain-containing protein n=1 Tax=Colocasia esculenta TaxID=4460 RepID=A0A843X5H8_COLES|nr:hypothetical protein [Colocasia esculenta]